MNHIKLKNKLVLLYFVCVLIPILIINFLFYKVTTQNIKDQKTVDAHLAIDTLQQEFRTLIDDTAGLAYIYYMDTELAQHLMVEYDSPAQYVEYYEQIKNTFNRSKNEFQRINASKIYTTNASVLQSEYIYHLLPQKNDVEWYEEFSEGDSLSPYLYSTPKQISLIQSLDFLGDRQYEHIIKFDFNMEYIANMFKATPFQGEIYLLDETNRVIYSSHQGHRFVEDAVYKSDLILPDNPIEIENMFENTRYLNGWKIFAVMNEDIILDEVSDSGAFIFPLAIVSTVIPTIIIILISRNINGRIRKILEYMKGVKGRQYTKIPFETHRDEIGQLAGEYNRMMERLDHLIDDVYVAEIQKKELEIGKRQAQLNALHSQINPHFLFNALESIRMRSLMKGEHETAKTIQNMATIFRKSISWHKSFVTVKEELELIESFLQIQTYRFGGKLQYSIITDEKVLNCEIPKMTILPFVENASIHGIENIAGIGLVTIQAAIYEEKIQFVIQDNGNGMSEKKLTELNQYLSEDMNITQHVGMKNVMMRLKIYYGEQFVFKVESNPQMGTKVTLIIPLQPIINKDES